MIVVVIFLLAPLLGIMVGGAGALIAHVKGRSQMRNALVAVTVVTALVLAVLTVLGAGHYEVGK